MKHHDLDNQIYPLKINPVIENHDYQFYCEKLELRTSAILFPELFGPLRQTLELNQSMSMPSSFFITCVVY